MKQLILLLLIIFCLLGVSLPITQANNLPAPSVTEADPMTIDVGPTWDSAPPGILLSTNAPLGAEIPIIRSSPDGSLLMTVYNRWMTGQNDRDPYYVISTNNGQSWSNPAPIYTSTSTNSGETYITFDVNNIVHAVWSEPTGILYSRYSSGSWSSPQTISPPTFNFNAWPHIFASGTNTLDIIWGAGNLPSQQPDIYHLRSLDGGQNWSGANPVYSSIATSSRPNIGVDSSGYLHAVWQERTATPGNEIRYAQGLPSGATVFWSAPIIISSVGTVDANTPRINIVNDDLHVTYAETVAGTPAVQFIHYTVCGANCILNASWASPQNISQQAVVVNQSDPYFLVSELVSGNNCLFVFFHGKQSDQANETVWDINSCSGWNSGGRDQVTSPADRAIYPSATIYSGFVHAAYQRVIGSDRQIYYMRGNLPQGVFLPFFRKP